MQRGSAFPLCLGSMKRIHIKKAWHFSPSLESLRSWTTYSSQLQRVKPTPFGGSVIALLWEEFLKVSKFQ